MARALPIASLVLSTLLVGCKGPPLEVPAAQSPSLALFGLASDQQATILDAIELHSEAVLVRYDPEHPNRLQWIDCPARVRWDYEPAQQTRVETMPIANMGELEVRAPLGRERFAGYLEGDRPIEIQYLPTARYSTYSDPRVRRKDPECARATHYVTDVHVGAMALDDPNDPRSQAGNQIGAVQRPATSIELCRDPNLAFRHCFTPLHVLLRPLSERHWRDDNADLDALPQPDMRLTLDVDQARWGPGSYMARSLERVLVGALRRERTAGLRLDDADVTLALGYVGPERPDQWLRRELEAGATYVVFAGTTGPSVELELFEQDASTVLVGDTGSFPAFSFEAPATGHYAVRVSITDSSEAFASVLITRADAGVETDVQTLRNTLQRVLDLGRTTAETVVDKGFEGAFAYDHDFALHTQVLEPNTEVIWPELHADRPTVFLGRAHDDAFNLDLQLLESPSGEQWADDEPDANPVLILDEPDASASYSLVIGHAPGESATLASTLILTFGEPES